ncbi:MAG: DUF1700 domain-containing protein [Lachnospiraceae bacterium]|nr:DUF1700 domain-containing protein [Lachnospiraceae bacterium]
MEKVLESYLEKVSKCLKRIPVSERADIIKEIESDMSELQNSGKTSAEIIERLGEPQNLAKAYLGDLLVCGNGFSWNRFLTICAFYSVAGFSGMIVIPSLAIIAPVFIICGVLVPVLAFVKMADNILGLGIPYMENIKIIFNGIEELTPVAGFIFSVVVGVLLYLAGKGAWKLLMAYCRKTSRIKSKLSV